MRRISLVSLFILFTLFTSNLFIAQTQDITQELHEEIREEIEQENNVSEISDDDGIKIDETQNESAQSQDHYTNLSESLRYRIIFPEYADSNLPSGIPIRVLIGLKHSQPQNIVLRSIWGALHHHKQFSHSLQNFSRQNYDIEISPGIETTVQYNFWPHYSFSNHPFIFVINSIITDDNEFKFAFYNSSLVFRELVESNFDLQLISIFVLFIGILGGVGYYLWISGLKERFCGEKKKEIVERGTISKDEIDYNWLPKECYLDHNNKKTTTKKKVA